MNNMELTNAVHTMSAQITELNNKLAKVIPEIYQKISDSESDISILFKSLKMIGSPTSRKLYRFMMKRNSSTKNWKASETIWRAKLMQ